MTGDLRGWLQDAIAFTGVICLVIAAAMVDVALGFAAAGTALIGIAVLLSYARQQPEESEEPR